jgi:hypothetical protein
MVVGPVWLKTVSDCTANYRLVLLTERVPHFKNQTTVRLKKRKGKIWLWAPKEGQTPRLTGRPTVGRNINNKNNNKNEVQDRHDIRLECRSDDWKMRQWWVEEVLDRVSALWVKSCCGYGMRIVGTQEIEHLPMETSTRGLVKDSRQRGPSACVVNCR